MMRNFFGVVIITVTLLAGVQASAQQFTFSGNISNAPAGAKLYFEFTNSEGKSQRDSCLLQNGAFTFQGKINSPEVAFLHVFTGPFKYIDDESPNAASFFLEPGNITANGSYDKFKTLKYTGSATQTEFAALNKVTDDYNTVNKPKFDNLSDMFKQRSAVKKQNPNDPRIAKFDKSIDSLREHLLGGYDKIYRPYIASHPQSYVSAFYLVIQKSQWPLPEVKKYYAAFTPAIRQSRYGQEIQKYLLAKDDNAPGKPAKNFTAIDVNGKSLNFESFKGKYVILDFWASWCVPCRASTPHLISLYHKYHPKGLEVIAVADNDDDKKAWKAAIKKDKTSMWSNVLRGMSAKQGYKDISDIYGIDLLPTKILIDKNGTIIGRYTGEDAADLDKKLAEVF